MIDINPYHARARRIQAKTAAIVELAETYAQRIFTEQFQGDAMADAIEDLIADHEDPKLFGDANGMDLLSEIETQYYDLVWHHIMAKLGARIKDTVDATIARHPAHPPRRIS